jgi:hypothetical protein
MAAMTSIPDAGHAEQNGDQRYQKTDAGEQRNRDEDIAIGAFALSIGMSGAPIQTGVRKRSAQDIQSKKYSPNGKCLTYQNVVAATTKVQCGVEIS